MEPRAAKAWPALDEARHLGKRIERVDGPDKAAGRARYTYDVQRPNQLYLKFLLCPHAHARVRSVDAAEAAAMPGVAIARAIHRDGYEVEYCGQEVAVVAADSEEQARAAAARVKVDFEVLPHNVVDDPLENVPPEFVSPGRSGGDAAEVEAILDAAPVVASGSYGAPIITHCCLESHGSVVEFPEEERLNAWISTQSVTGIAGEYQTNTGVPAANITVECQHLGGGFGSKFNLDAWDAQAAAVAEETGRPVKVMLERDHELMVAGSRPSGYANVQVACEQDGSLLAWWSQSWGAAGAGSRNRLRLPYVFQVPKSYAVHTEVATHTGPTRAWRAPNHPQICLITMSALEDAAAALGMDPVAFFKKNLALTDRADVYAEELDVAARLMDWTNRWQSRGSRSGPVRRGHGLSLHTWGGGGHGSRCEVRVHENGAVEVSLGTQDLGTGTRTVVTIVAAETFGLPLEAVTAHIGSSRLPPSGGSGGSTTVGGVSSSTRVAATDALNQLLEKVAPELDAAPGDLEAKEGAIRVAADPSRAMAWAEACRLIGTAPLVGNGQTDRELMDQGVGGVQMAEVTVDVETGVVTMEKLVAVQDCGTVVDLQTAESQVYGGCIMGITSALFEERVCDPATGRVLNPDMEFYRLAGIGDVGEIVVHMMQTPEHHGRGVIGLGEPPVISPMAAIANAVANAIGVRVPRVPLTPLRVLAAFAQGGK